MNPSDSSVERDSGNVFADLDHPVAHLLKAELVSPIDGMVRHRGITRTKATRALGLAQARHLAGSPGRLPRSRVRAPVALPDDARTRSRHRHAACTCGDRREPGTPVVVMVNGQRIKAAPGAAPPPHCTTGRATRGPTRQLRQPRCRRGPSASGARAPHRIGATPWSAEPHRGAKRRAGSPRMQCFHLHNAGTRWRWRPTDTRHRSVLWWGSDTPSSWSSARARSSPKTSRRILLISSPRPCPTMPLAVALTMNARAAPISSRVCARGRVSPCKRSTIPARSTTAHAYYRRLSRALDFIVRHMGRRARLRSSRPRPPSHASTSSACSGR